MMMLDAGAVIFVVDTRMMVFADADDVVMIGDGQRLIVVVDAVMMTVEGTYSMPLQEQSTVLQRSVVVKVHSAQVLAGHRC